jgi:redox-sensitive bicupin YhaK (pirin superfamily)
MALLNLMNMKTQLHKADTRGVANFGWLDSKHSFSFGNYYNPDRIQFGALRVLNDDIVEPGYGFGTHPHDNMEIVSIPLSGTLAHKDSTGNERTIETGEVQIMSAGTGLTHSEYNHSKKEKVNFLQVWVLPKERNIKPRYDQRFFDFKENDFTTVVAPNQDEALWINQDAWFSVGNLNEGKEIAYQVKQEGNGVFVFVIDGLLLVEGNELSLRDAIEIEDASSIKLSTQAESRILIIEVPMK